MSIVGAMAQMQPAVQLCLFAAMLVHMIRHFSPAESARMPAPPVARDDIPLWPYGS